MVDVLFLTAMVSEFAEVSRALGNGWPRADFLRIKHGHLGPKTSTVVQLGIGPKRARKGTLKSIEELRPDRVIVVGVCGGLQNDLSVGTVILPHEVALESGECLPIDASPTHWPSARTVDRLLTCDTVATTPTTKHRLAQEHRAAVVDMETFSIVGVCRERGLPVHVVRVVSDGVADELPAEIGQLINEEGNPSLFRAFQAFLRRPRLLPEILRLEANNKVAFQAMQEWLSALVKAEVEQPSRR